MTFFNLLPPPEQKKINESKDLEYYEIYGRHSHAEDCIGHPIDEGKHYQGDNIGIPIDELFEDLKSKVDVAIGSLHGYQWHLYQELNSVNQLAGGCNNTINDIEVRFHNIIQRIANEFGIVNLQTIELREELEKMEDSSQVNVDKVQKQIEQLRKQVKKLESEKLPQEEHHRQEIEALKDQQKKIFARLDKLEAGILPSISSAGLPSHLGQ
ncbi:MAG: hypothetical protein AAGG81_01025 [Chlamydiota bacterium]